MTSRAASVLEHLEEASNFVAAPHMQDALGGVLRIGGRDLLEKVVDLFQSMSRDRLEKMRSAVASGDRVQVSRLAHAMKGSAAQVGAEALRTMSFLLEQDAASLDVPTMAKRIAQIEREVPLVWAALEHFRATATNRT
ncbi:MAG: Hpt domain-containing protein [Gemmatimonadaceae bacterium]